MMKARTFLSFLIILLIIPMASAVAPIKAASFTNDGLVIIAPAIEYKTFNQSFNINVHVINKSDGSIITNKYTTCIYHLYNSSGEHLTMLNMTYHPNETEWEVRVNSDNFSYLGFYSRIIVCNYTNGLVKMGDASAFEFEVTRDGKFQSTAQGIGSLSYLLILLALTVTFFVLGFKFTESDYLWVLGFFFIIFGFYLTLIDVWTGYEYYKFLTGMGDSAMMQTLFYILLTAILAGLVVSLAVMFKNWKRIKNEIVKAVNEKEDEDEDGWDKNDFDNK